MCHTCPLPLLAVPEVRRLPQEYVHGVQDGRGVERRLRLPPGLLHEAVRRPRPLQLLRVRRVPPGRRVRQGRPAPRVRALGGRLVPRPPRYRDMVPMPERALPGRVPGRLAHGRRRGRPAAVGPGQRERCRPQLDGQPQRAMQKRCVQVQVVPCGELGRASLAPRDGPRRPHHAPRGGVVGCGSQALRPPSAALMRTE